MVEASVRVRSFDPPISFLRQLDELMNAASFESPPVDPREPTEAACLTTHAALVSRPSNERRTARTSDEHAEHKHHARRGLLGG
jgi:hypothetical protein